MRGCRPGPRSSRPARSSGVPTATRNGRRSWPRATRRTWTSSVASAGLSCSHSSAPRVNTDVRRSGTGRVQRTSQAVGRLLQAHSHPGDRLDHHRLCPRRAIPRRSQRANRGRCESGCLRAVDGRSGSRAFHRHPRSAGTASSANAAPRGVCFQLGPGGWSDNPCDLRPREQHRVTRAGHSGAAETRRPRRCGVAWRRAGLDHTCHLMGPRHDGCHKGDHICHCGKRLGR